MAGYKMISIVLLVVLVALAGVSQVFSQPSIAFDPPAACPGETVTVNLPRDDIVGGGISIAAVSPLSDGTTIVLSSDPAGLIANSACFPDVDFPFCTFLVSESASCGHYTVIVALSLDEVGRDAFRGPFDVAGPCCAAVGGCVQPVNTFALVSPYLALIAIVGCIGTVAVVAKKRQS